jgi:P27 family predicted phage terminase small subunit
MTAHRKSNLLKLMRGTAREDRKPKRDFARRLYRAPLPPSHLSARAASEWRGLARAAVSLGTLTGADLRAFELLAVTLATESEARDVLAREGLTVPTAGGGRKAHPGLRTAETARAQAATLLAAFGLTPRGRQSVDVLPPSPAGDLSAKYF